ncbi:AIPR family protein [Alteromonas sp. 14N.309.X.WAT.G.H12]|uniref:AIPR family protein n=1 Tax=Alteromonas sp. 14N.309.X.WAT.G.H12 TaxID=3120824 RepID=UPI002FD19D32
MASLNDFNYLETKCLSYFEMASKEINFKISDLDNVKKARIGFYFLLLEQLTGISDFSELCEKITDTEFNSFLGADKLDDFGVDAVDIDEDEKIIRLFSFKYRGNFSTKMQRMNEALLSSKYFNLVASKNTQNISGKLRSFTRKIIDALNSKKEWAIDFYFISNDGEELKKDAHLSNFSAQYDIRFVPIALPKLKQIFSIRPNPINAEVNLLNDAIMTYCETQNSTDKNFIVRMSCSELIRITCSNEELRLNAQLEDYTVLQDVDLDFGVLFDNVRGFVTKSKFNPNIAASLADSPNKFFLFNNGITIVAKDISTKEINGRTSTKVKIGDFQILNGGQTLRTIHKFNRDDGSNIDGELSEAQVLVRIFMVREDDKSLINDIAEFTNSQNKVQPSDLKSLRHEQLLIERILDDNEIVYSRKTGDTGLNASKVYSTKISMETLGQILYSIGGSPEKATSEKQKIFNEHYERVFVDELNIKQIPDIVRQFESVKDEYKKSDFKGVNIKYFYIMFLLYRFENSEIATLIEELEYVLNTFEVENEMSDVRKMGRTGFKDQLIQHLQAVIV